MKYTFLLTILLFAACGTDSTSPGDEANAEETEVIPEDVISEMTLDAEHSTINWKRFLDQKATKKNIKLFGAMAEVEMGPVKLNMEGNVSPSKGALKLVNDACESGNLFFDMTTFKFAEESGQGLFDVKNYPESELTFDTFNALKGDAKNNTTVTMTLTIQKHSEKITAPMRVTNDGKTCTIKGDFTFNTLDFPLRDNARKKDINKDEITVFLDLNYTLR
jgi:hypothetical protein